MMVDVWRFQDVLAEIETVEGTSDLIRDRL